MPTSGYKYKGGMQYVDIWLLDSLIEKTRAIKQTNDSLRVASPSH